MFPRALVGSAVARVRAVMLSVFLMPVIVPVNSGLGSPYKRPALAAATVSGAGLTVSVPLFEVTV